MWLYISLTLSLPIPSWYNTILLQQQNSSINVILFPLQQDYFDLLQEYRWKIKISSITKFYFHFNDWHSKSSVDGCAHLDEFSIPDSVLFYILNRMKEKREKESMCFHKCYCCKKLFSSGFRYHIVLDLIGFICSGGQVNSKFCIEN